MINADKNTMNNEAFQHQSAVKKVEIFPALLGQYLFRRSGFDS
jgi:hypothetical protein